MKKLLGRIIGVGVMSALLIVAAVWGHWGSSQTAFAIGDLIIDWGVTAGQPIFVVNNFAPGDSETRNVDVTNNASVTREVGVIGANLTGDTALAGQLEIVIAQSGVDLYGGTSSTGMRTVADFVADGTLADPIVLTNINAGQTVQLDFTVKFKETAGNDFQNTSVTLNITIGLTGAIVGLPAECVGFDLSNANVIMGTQGGDILRGTAGRDVIFGLEGGDLIIGNGEDDCLVGGPGGDLVRGGSGNDIIFGNEAGDSLLGGDGDDQLFGGTGGDSLVGGPGNDRLFGNEDGDSLEGGGGNDVAFGGSGGDGLTGGSGNDELFGEAGQDAANGGSGTDQCEAEAKTSCEG